MIITIQVDAQPWQALGIKEDLVSYLERFGDAKVISVEQYSAPMEQIILDGRKGR